MRPIAAFIFAFFLAVPAFSALPAPHAPDVREHVILDSRDPKSGRPTTYIAFLGDYGLTRKQYEAMDGQSRHDLKALLAYLHRKGDIIVNFEFLPPASDIFSVDFLAASGVAGAIVSNNHACDAGAQGLAEGARQLSLRRVQPFGTLRAPYLDLARNGSKYAVYALTEALDFDCAGVNTARARDHKAQVRALARSRTVILYAHDPGPSFYVTDYEDRTALRYIDMGAKVVIIDGSHNMKGARQHGGALSIFGLGNFLLTYRDSEEFLSVAAVVGFDREKPVYLGIIPFYDKRGAVFRLLHGKEADAAAGLYRERGLPAGERAYRDASTVRLVRASLIDLLHGRNIERLKWKHLSIFASFVYHNYFWPCCALGVLLAASAFQAGRLIRKTVVRRRSRTAEIEAVASTGKQGRTSRCR
jgi:hypothetical protein